ncbi:MAG: hypothetical protein F4Z60_06910 [Chloroflexi bacterium]|nr:hypothetical protein [Chloroflexota bacterium]
MPTKRTIGIQAFVKLDEIDPVYHEKAYYLEPDEAGEKPFALLVRALEAKGLVAVAQVAIRNKERLCALRAPGPDEEGAAHGGGRILLETLYYPDEIRTAQLDPLDLEEVSEEELQMAFTLIGMLEKPFEPEEYHDEYREALMAVINAKLEGVELAEAAEPETAKIVDLMAALRASVEAASRDRDDEPDETADAEPAAAEARAS